MESFKSKKEEVKMKLIRDYTEEVGKEISEIGKLKHGSEEYKATVDGTAKLTSQLVDLKKIELEEMKISYEHEEKMKAHELEISKTRSYKRDQYFKNGIAIAGILIPVAGAIWATVYSWVKEENGTMTYTGGNKAMNFLFF